MSGIGSRCMTKLKLNYLDELDLEAQEQHEKWLVKQPVFRELAKHQEFQKAFIAQQNLHGGFLCSSELWSNKRIYEASIIKNKNETESYFIWLNKYIENRISELSAQVMRFNDDYAEWILAYGETKGKKTFNEYYKDNFTQKIRRQLEELEEFQKKYQEFHNDSLKEFLTNAIVETLKQFPNTKEFENFSNPPTFETHDEFVSEYANVTKICKKHTEQLVNQPGPKISKTALLQLETLKKCQLNLYEEQLTKKTKPELVLTTAAAATSTLALVTGIGAAVCWIGGFVFPPLHLIAGFLTWCTVVGYIATGITVFNVVKDASKGCPPTKKDVKDLVIEAVLAPFNVVKSIARPIIHALKSTKAIKAVKDTSKVINNIIDNTTDLRCAKETVEDTKKALELISANKESSKKGVTCKVVKVEMKKQLRETAACNETGVSDEENRDDDADSNPVQETQKPLKKTFGNEIVVSLNEHKKTDPVDYHLEFIDWSLNKTSWKPEFFKTTTISPEIKPIKVALLNYKTLCQDQETTIAKRSLALAQILGQCEIYYKTLVHPLGLKEAKEFAEVQKLYNASALEFERLNKSMSIKLSCGEACSDENTNAPAIRVSLK